MKIQHASKKVLAAALSAAMVVAFAPPSALGLSSGGKVTVEFSAGDGTGSLGSYEYTADTSGHVTLAAHPGDIYGAFTNGYYDLAGYFYDENGNGVCDSGELGLGKSSFDTNAPFIWGSVTDGSTVKFVACYNNVGLASATETSIGSDTYTLNIACTNSNAKITYKIDNGGDVDYNSSTGITNVDPTSKVEVTATLDGRIASDETFIGYKNNGYFGTNGPIGNFDGLTDTTSGILSKTTVDGTTTYGSIPAIAAAKNAGDAAIKEQGFTTQSRWIKLINEQKVAVMEAVIDYAKGQIGDLRKPVAANEGKNYTKLSNSDYSIFVGELEAIDLEKTVDPAAFVNKVNSAITMAKSRSSSTWFFTAADVNAAKPVSDLLQAAKNATDAKAAIEAYNKLTSTQKEIVYTTDVLAAYDIIVKAADEEAAAAKKKAEQAEQEAAAADRAAAAASREAEQAKEEAAAAKKEAEQAKAEATAAKENAEQKAAEADAAKKDAEQKATEAEQAKEEAAAVNQELVKEQDKAAVKYCNSTKKKIVKLAKEAKKTAKKLSVKWNSLVSESGSAVTYAKTSGNAKIKVSAKGVATLKKGVKKGTYKAKVKVTCGSATRIVTAKFVVK